MYALIGPSLCYKNTVLVQNRCNRIQDGQDPNFSETEKFRLVEEFEKEMAIIKGKFSPTLTTRKKHDAWVRITEAINRRNPSVVRTDKELLKKWQNMCSVMKDEFRKHKKGKAKTGGGPPPEDPSILSQNIAAVLGEEDPTVYGIVGGIDSIDEGFKPPTPQPSGSTRRESPDSEPETISTPRMQTHVTTIATLTRPCHRATSLPNPCPPLADTVNVNKRKIDDNKDIIVIQKELLNLEKFRAKLEIEKLEIEKEKLLMEKHTLSLEINVLNIKRQRLANTESNYQYDNNQSTSAVDAYTLTNL